MSAGGPVPGRRNGPAGHGGITLGSSEMVRGAFGLIAADLTLADGQWVFTDAGVAEINAGRAQAYRDIAPKTGVSEQAAGEAAARQLIARAPPGSYYKPLEGGWMRK